jgi:hypothetical protein
MKYFRLLPVLTLIVTLAGCGGSGSPSSPSTAYTRPSDLIVVPPTPTPTAEVLNLTGQWTAFGPNPAFDDAVQNINVSGRVASLLALGNETLLVGSAQGGVWRTDDGGQTYAPLTDDAVNLAIGALAADPANPAVVYAGTGEGTGSSDPLYGSGLLLSTDGGHRFSLIPGTDTIFDRMAISRIVVRPDSSVLAGTFRVDVNARPGQVYGVYRGTAQGGFSRIFPSGTESLSISDLAENPQNGDVYVAVSGSAETDDGTSGVYFNASGTPTFEHLTAGLPASVGRTELSMAADGSRLYAVVGLGTVEGPGGSPAEQSDKFAGIYMLDTTDPTQGWTQVTSDQDIGAALGGQSTYSTAIAVDPADPTTVYAGGDTQLVRVSAVGADGTGQLQIFPTRDATHPHPDVQCLTFAPDGTLLTGTDGGVWALPQPAAATDTTPWIDLQGVPGQALATIQYTMATLDAADTRRAIGGTQDNGTHRTEDNLVSRIVATGDGGYAIWDALRPNVVYQTYQRAGEVVPEFLHVSTDGGLTFNVFTQGLDPTEPGEFYAPYTQHPNAPDRRLALGTIRIWERRANDARWFPASSAFPAIVSSVAYAPSDEGVLYAGLTNGQVWVRTQDGLAFRPSGGGLPSTSISSIAVDPEDPRIAWCTTNAFGVPTVYRTEDEGLNWIAVDAGLPRLPANWIAAERRSGETILYVGLNQQVYATADGRAAALDWQLFGQGLPNCQVFSLDIKGGVLLAATHGRGLFEIPTGPGPAIVGPPAVQLTPIKPDEPPINEGDKIQDLLLPLPIPRR